MYSFLRFGTLASVIAGLLIILGVAFTFMAGGPNPQSHAAFLAANILFIIGVLALYLYQADRVGAWALWVTLVFVGYFVFSAANAYANLVVPAHVLAEQASAGGFAAAAPGITTALAVIGFGGTGLIIFRSGLLPRTAGGILLGHCLVAVPASALGLILIGSLSSVIAGLTASFLGWLVWKKTGRSENKIQMSVAG